LSTKTRYFNPVELSNYVAQGKIASDLISEQAMSRCSIADFVDLCELQKKGRLNLSLAQLLERLELFAENSTLDGMVFVADLDRETLSKALFVERNPSKLWLSAATREIPPLHSVRRLTLRDSEWEFWGENVYMEMEEFFSEQLTDG